MPGAVIERMLESVRRHAHVDVAYLTSYEDEATTVRAVAGDGTELGVQPGDRVDAEASLCLAAVTGSAPSTVPDLRADRRLRRMADAGGLHVGGFAAVPVHLADGSLFGALCVASREPLEDLGASTQVLLAVVADVVADELAVEVAELRDVQDERDELMAVVSGGGMATLVQPIVDLVTGRVRGVEALTRFTAQPQRPPDLWFARAARLGVAAELEVAAVERAIGLLPRLPADWYLAVNASPGVVAAGGLDDVVVQDVAARLVVEVTEHAAVADYVDLTAALDRLRGRGVRIAVDDVGAGFSSFRHVLELRPDLLKVDRSIVRGCDVDPMHRAMVESVAGFASRAGADVVAEAVETPDELAVLQHLGLPAAQGYLFAAPCDPEDLRPAYPVRVPRWATA